MNAKELREAAAWIKERIEGEMMECANNPSYLDEYGKSIEDERACVDYILATVRDDDDEPVTSFWLSGFGDVMDGFHYIGIICVDATEWEWSLSGMFASSVSIHAPKTRGQFRSLCRGLGIALKEGGQ